jgi:hypothetical protein
MNDREIKANYEFYRYRRRRLRFLASGVALAGLVLVLAALALLGKLPSFTLSPSPSGRIPPEALFVNSGLARTTVTRTTVLVDTVSPAADGKRSTPDVPNVVTAVMQADPQDASTKAQFPAAQVQLSASPLGRGRVRLSAVIDLGQPQHIAGALSRSTRGDTSRACVPPPARGRQCGLGRQVDH